jgi:hypothetical protein
MLNRIISRVIYAVISATILSIIGNYISSRLEGLPRILRDGWLSGANHKTGRQGKRDTNSPNDCKAIDASNRTRREYSRRNSRPKNQRGKNQARMEQNRRKAAVEMKLKSQRQCLNRNGRNISDANIKDRAFSQRCYK